MRLTDKATVDNRSVQSFAIIKNTAHGNFVIGRFDTKARNGSSRSETSLAGYSRVLPTDTPSTIFSEGRGRLYTGYLERIIPSSKVRRIVHSKLKLFHFQIKKYYLSDANHQTECENGHFCYNECRGPALSWAFACPLLLFHKDYF